MLGSEVEDLLKKSVLADPQFPSRKFAPSKEEDRVLKRQKREYHLTHLKGWYNMRKIDPKTDAHVQKDLELIQYRNFLVDDRIYRRPEKTDLPHFAEIGTVVCDDIIDSLNLPVSKRSKSLYEEWMKSDRLRGISDRISSQDFIQQGSSTLGQPNNTFCLPKEKPGKLFPQKKNKFKKRKRESS